MYYITVIMVCKVVFIAAETTEPAVTYNKGTELFLEVTEEPETKDPESDFAKAMDLDYGTYTTETFPYVNGQYGKLEHDDICFDDYTKCLVTQGNAHSVCAVNDPRYIARPYGFVTFNSYCDVYYDNCSKGHRYWQILDNGKCYFDTSFLSFNYFDIARPRKSFGNLPSTTNKKSTRNIFQLLFQR